MKPPLGLVSSHYLSSLSYSLPARLSLLTAQLLVPLQLLVSLQLLVPLQLLAAPKLLAAPSTPCPPPQLLVAPCWPRAELLFCAFARSGGYAVEVAV